MKSNPLPRLLRMFFTDWMVQQRNASVNTVKSYRDTWRLFLRFVAARRGKPIVRLDLNELTATEVIAFLHHLEVERGDTIGTRNCRLAALRSFFGFVATREPELLPPHYAVLAITPVMTSSSLPQPVVEVGRVHLERMRRETELLAQETGRQLRHIS